MVLGLIKHSGEVGIRARQVLGRVECSECLVGAKILKKSHEYFLRNLRYFHLVWIIF